MTREEATQELVEWITQMIEHGVPNYSTKYKALKLAIEALQAEPTIGEWIDVENEPYCECSVCGAYIDNLDDDYAFCPNCGADMRGENE